MLFNGFLPLRRRHQRRGLLPGRQAETVRQVGRDFREVQRLESRRLLTMPGAPSIGLDFTDFGSASGEITDGVQPELFRFDVPTTGRYVIDQAAAESSLDSFLRVLDEDCNPVAVNDDGSFGPDSRVELFANAGEVFFLEAGSSGASTGAFTLTVARDDFDNNFSNAGAIFLDDEGNGLAFGEIERDFDNDLFELTSPLTGTLTIQLNAADQFFDPLLVVFDSQGSQIGFNDNFNGVNSQVDIAVEAGDRLFIQANDSFALPGFYDVVVSGDFGDTDFDAADLAVPRTGSTLIFGAISTQGDIDVFQISSPVTGTLAVDLFATDSSLDAVLTVRDVSGFPIAVNDGVGDVSVLVSVSAGEQIFVEAADFFGSLNAYGLSVTTGDFDGNDDFSATPLFFDPLSGTQVFGGIDYVGDADVFAITSAVSGTLSFDLVGTDGIFDGDLSIRDASGTEIARNNAFGDVSIDVPVLADEQLFVEVADFFGTPGFYQLSISVPDDFGNDQFTSEPLTVDPVAGATVFGAVDFEFDVDVFSVVAPVTGSLTFDLFAANSSLDADLTIFDEFGNFVTQNNGIGDVRSGVSAESGQEFFVEVRDFFGSPQAYGLTVQASDQQFDDFGNNLLTASPLALDPFFGDAFVDGAINFQDDIDVFEIVSPIDGLLSISLAGSTELFAPSLTVFNEFGTVVADGFDFDFLFLDVPVGTNERLFVQVEDIFGAPAAYFLDIFGLGVAGPDSAPTEPGTPVALDAAGNGMVSGRIGDETGFDVFEITVPLTTSLIIEQIATSPIDFLDPCPTVFSANGTVLASAVTAEFFVQENGLLGTRLFVEADEGDELTITAGSFSGVGDYDLIIRPAPADDFQDVVDVAVATRIELNPAGTTSQSGVIGVPGDRDVFAVRAISDGVLTIQQTAVEGSELDSILTVFAENGDFLDSNDDSLFSAGPDSRLDLPVVAGQRLLVSAAGFFSSTGSYDLLFSISDPIADDFGNTIGLATPLTLDSSGFGQQAGAIEQVSDLDFFSVMVPGDVFSLTVQQSSPDGELDSFLSVFDSQGFEIVSNDDSNFTLDSEVVVATIPGEQLFIRAGAFSSSTGSYSLQIQTGNAADDEVGDVDTSAAPLLFDPLFNDVFVDGSLESVGDRDVYTATFDTDGTVHIFLDAVFGWSLDPLLRVRDSNGTEVASSNDSAGGLNSQAIVAVSVGEQLFFDVGASADASAGAYFLDVFFFPGVVFTAEEDDFPVNDIIQARDAGLPERAVSADSTLLISGSIEVGEDADVFLISVPGDASETVDLRIQMATEDAFDFFGFGSLDPVLTVFGAASNVPIAFNDDSFFSLDSDLVVTVPGGSTLFVQAGAFGFTTGDYRLSLELIEDDFVDVISGAETLEFGSAGAVNGFIERSADIDVFRIGTPERPDGEQPDEVRVQVNQTATDGTFDGFLSVFRQVNEGSLELVAFNDDSNGTRNSSIEFELKVNATYFVFAEAFGSTTGDYELSINTVLADDVGDSFAGATVIPVEGLNDVAFPEREITSGDVSQLPDQDVFFFLADRTGTGTVELNSATDLDGRISVFEVDTTAALGSPERQPVRIARISSTAAASSGNSGPLAATFPLTEDNEYFVVVDSASGEGAGTYNVDLRLNDQAFDNTLGIVPDEVLDRITQLVREQFAAGVDLESIIDAAARELQTRFGDIGSNEFLLFVADPVDFVLADSQDQKVGFTADQGRINEINGAGLSQNAPIEVLILPTTARQFPIQLQGVGSSFQVGARIVTQDNVISGQLVDQDTGQTMSRSGMLAKSDDGNVALVFDFTDSGQNAFPRPVNPGPTAESALNSATDADTSAFRIAPGDQIATAAAATRAMQDLRDAEDNRLSGQDSARQNLLRWLIESLQKSDQQAMRTLAGPLESLADALDGDDSDDATNVSGSDVFWSIFGGGVMNRLWELGEQIIDHTTESDSEGESTDPDSQTTDDQKTQPDATGDDAASSKDGTPDSPTPPPENSKATGQPRRPADSTSAAHSTDENPWKPSESAPRLTAQLQARPTWTRRAE